MQLIKLVSEILEKEGISEYKIYDKLVCNGYPESYIFIEKIGKTFELGSVNRNHRKVDKIFNVEEKALMYFMNVSYRKAVNIIDSKTITDKFFELNHEEKKKFILDMIPSNIAIDFENYKIVYYDKKRNKKVHISYTEKAFVNRTAFATVCIIKSFEKTRDILIENGVLEEIVLDYFLLEDALQKHLNIIEIIYQ